MDDQMSTEMAEMLFEKLISCMLNREELSGSELLKEHPKLVDFDTDDSGGNLLHSLSRRKFIVNAKHYMSVFNYIMETYPHLVLSRNDQGQVPLHESCSSDIGWRHPGVLQQVINRPEILLVPDRQGSTALHLMCKQRARIEVIYQEWEWDYQWPDSECDLEYERAARLFRQHLNANPASLLVTDSHGQTPLHILCARGVDVQARSRWFDAEIIQIALERDPRAAKYRDDLGRTPLMLLLQGTVLLNLPSERALSWVKMCLGDSPVCCLGKDGQALLKTVRRMPAKWREIDESNRGDDPATLSDAKRLAKEIEALIHLHNMNLQPWLRAWRLLQFQYALPSDVVLQMESFMSEGSENIQDQWHEVKTRKSKAQRRAARSRRAYK